VAPASTEQFPLIISTKQDVDLSDTSYQTGRHPIFVELYRDDGLLNWEAHARRDRECNRRCGTLANRRGRVRSLHARPMSNISSERADKICHRRSALYENYQYEEILLFLNLPQSSRK
jgi:endo-beta-N-acetylglucosaminidase D